MEFITEYGLFLAKAVTVLIAIVIILVIIFANAAKGKKDSKGHLTVTNLNKELKKLAEQIRKEVLDHDQLRSIHKADKKKQKQDKKQAKQKSREESAKPSRKRMFVLDFNGDPKASQVENLRQEITAILKVANPATDEVVLRLESPGGMVHSYGLAASQLQRIRSEDIPLTICVDKMAASGGYMMACVGNRILAAPFAYIGSVGVLLQLPNFNKLLKQNHIEYEMVTAGEYKRTLTLFGENNDKGRAKVTEEVEDTHELFKEFIRDNRPVLDVDSISTGETWFGSRALEKALIDEVKTSDQYLLDASEAADIFAVSYEQKKSISDKLAFALEQAFDNTLLKWVNRSSSKSDFLN